MPDGASITDTLAQGTLRGPAADVRQLPAFELDPAPDDGHVCGLAATLRPPVTGDYRFLISGDDTALLYLSTSDRPADRRLIASVPSDTPPRTFDYYAAQTSRPVHLDAGHAYAIEAWLQNRTGVSHITVAWRRPDHRRQVPIPGQYLTPAAGPLSPPPFEVGPVTVKLSDDPEPLDKPGFHKRVAAAHCTVAGQAMDVSYLLWVPDHFETTTDRRPLLMFLHGNGHQGTDLWGAFNEGPANFLWRDASLRAAVPMLVLVPQLPEGWRWDYPGAATMVNALVRAVCQQYPRVDPKRVYLTGLSMGGKGAWLTALDAPDLYAAVSTFSAVAVQPATAAKRLAGIPHLDLTCGGDDGDFAAGSAAMYAALQPTFGDRVTLTTVRSQGHSVWSLYYPEPSFYKGLLRYSR